MYDVRTAWYNSNMDNLPDEQSLRFVAILNNKVETGKLMNALGHMAVGLGSFNNDGQMYFLEYRDKDGGIHPNISHFPFIVLKADNSSKIREVRKGAIKRGILFTDFTSTMTAGMSQEQLDRTKDTPEAELEYCGICLFGQTQDLREFTGKFSLFQ